MEKEQRFTDEELAISIAKIRETGLTNMFDRNKVTELVILMVDADHGFYLNDLTNQEFMRLLVLSGNY